jgi:site-specific recombinase XerD
MSIDHLLDRLSQAQILSDMDHLLDDKTLNGILRAWLFDCIEQNYSVKTLEHYRGKVSQFIEFVKPITNPADVTANHVRLFMITKRKSLTKFKTPVKPNTIHGFHRAINRFFSYMVEKKTLSVSPMLGMKPPKVPEVVIMP